MGFNTSAKNNFRKASFPKYVPINSNNDLTFSVYTQQKSSCNVCCVNLVQFC